MYFLEVLGEFTVPVCQSCVVAMCLVNCDEQLQHLVGVLVQLCLIEQDSAFLQQLHQTLLSEHFRLEHMVEVGRALLIRTPV